MATRTKRPNGSYRVRFTHTDGRQRELTFRRGRGDMATKAQEVVEKLVAAKIGGTSIDNSVLAWLAGVPDTLYEKLERLDLVPARRTTKYANATFADFATEFVEGGADGMAANTLRNHRQCLVRIRKFFGSTRLANLTEANAKQFNQWLKRDCKLSAATVSREMRRAKQYLAAAVSAKVITENIFAGTFERREANDNRQYFVTVEMIEQVMAACPDAEWRLIVALARYGGLRVPSELMGIRWCDVDWGEKRLTVDSPKNAGKRGCPYRVVPLFSELLPYLEDAYHQAAEGVEWVIARHRGTNINLRTQLLRIMRHAGVQPWPKLFVNMRSSRETELNDQYPMHVVCKWMDNSPSVALKHYLQTTDQHFADAVGVGGENFALNLPLQEPESGCEAMPSVQYSSGSSGVPVQYRTERHPHGESQDLNFVPDSANFVKVCPKSALPNQLDQLAAALASLAAIDGIGQRERDKLAQQVARKILDGQ